MGTDKTVPVLNDEHGRNNLEAIKGIGPTFSEALNRIGIHRFADLAQYAPQDLSKVLREQAGLKVPAERIESQKWIDQAKALAQQADVERTLPQGELEAAKESHNLPDRPAWRQHAGFSLFFDYVTDEHAEQAWQTRVYHDESGEETLVRGLETIPWVNWILERAHLPVVTEPILAEAGIAIEPPSSTRAMVTALPAATPKCDARIEIVDVQVSEVGPILDVLQKKLMATIHFLVLGDKAEALAADQVSFRVEVHAVDLEKGISSLIASGSSQLKPQVLEYTSRQEFAMPDVGRYELHSIVLLLPPNEMMTHHRGPTFKVIP